MEHEDQQVEQIKQFVKEYGPWILAGIVLGLGSLFGWRHYQDNQIQAAESRTATYQQMLETLQFSIDDDSSMRAEALAAELEGTEQGALAQLHLAQNAVSAADFDAARAYLIGAHGSLRSGQLKSIVALRLARVEIARADLPAARAWLAGITDAAFAAYVAEIRGDIYYAEGNLAAARGSYIAAADASEGGASTALQMKIDNLAGHE